MEAVFYNFSTLFYCAEGYSAQYSITSTGQQLLKRMSKGNCKLPDLSI